MADLEFAVQGLYSDTIGWEDVTVEDTRAGADEMCQTYDREEPQYRHRVKARPVEDGAS